MTRHIEIRVTFDEGYDPGLYSEILRILIWLDEREKLSLVQGIRKTKYLREELNIILPLGVVGAARDPEDSIRWVLGIETFSSFEEFTVMLRKSRFLDEFNGWTLRMEVHAQYSTI